VSLCYDAEKARARAACVLDRLKDGDKFDHVAFRFSEGPARDRDLGYFVHSKLAKSLEDTISPLEEGAILLSLSRRFPSVIKPALCARHALRISGRPLDCGWYRPSFLYAEV
jgi:hypothetical protein